jgi:hypothetical protein
MAATAKPITFEEWGRSQLQPAALACRCDEQADILKEYLTGEFKDFIDIKERAGLVELQARLRLRAVELRAV